jgi:hypothetical protein
VWRAAARQAAAYRDRWNIDDQERALGYEPDHGQQKQQWHDATDALERANTVEAEASSEAAAGHGVSPWARTRPARTRDEGDERRRLEDQRRRDEERRRGLDRDL